jgi:hypothetical protein
MFWYNKKSYDERVKEQAAAGRRLEPPRRRRSDVLRSQSAIAA